MDELEIQNLICQHLKIKIEKETSGAGEYDKAVVTIYYDNWPIDSDWIYIK